MKCIYCGYNESKVVDSRATDDNTSIRRRRECLKCGKRFTTYEQIDTIPLLVIKNDGSRQPFDANKIRNGIIKACEKRPVSLMQINGIVEEIEKKLQNTMVQEIKSSDIGEMVMEKLKNIDEVSYVRFASVYKKFTDVTNFLSFLKNLGE